MKSTKSAGILVLGMHRSGTSALAHVLHLGGANIGSRLLSASAGNEAGHWEDALAVEVHERLLASFGSRWDQAFALPSDWARGEAAAAARDTILGYLKSNRSRHRLWAAKDPRLCLFAGLWREAAAELQSPIAAVLVLRHPLEVARSLAARDGIAPGRAMLLWLEYTLAAVTEAEQIPCAVIEYSQLLADWRGCIDRLRGLPGGEVLAYDDTAAGLVEGFLDSGLRHHDESGSAGMPHVVAEVWQVLAGLAQKGKLPKGTAARLASSVATVRELLHPLLDEWRVAHRLLWERVARAESPLVETATLVAAVPASLDELGERVDQHRADLIEAFSNDVRHMQATTTEAVQAMAAAESEARLARQIAPRIEAVEAMLEPLPERISNEFRSLVAGMGQNQGVLIEAISSDLRRMQDVSAAALQAAAVREREAELAGQIEPRLAAIAAVIPRHEAAIAALAKADIGLARAEAELREKQRSLVEMGLVREQELGRLQDAQQQARSLSAECAERQREITGLRLESDRLRELAVQFENVKSSRSWRWTRPLRVARRILAGEWGASDASKLRGLTRSAVAKTPFLSRNVRVRLIEKTLTAEAGLVADLPDASMSQMITLAGQKDGVSDVFIWSVIDWHFRTQRPQHLARAMAAKGHRVFYISNNFVDSPEPGFHIDPIDGQGRLFQIHLHHALAPAIYFGMPEQIQVERMRSSLARLLEWTCTASSLSIVQHPYWSELVRAVPNSRVVYDCMDHHAGFENNAPSVLEAERRLVEDSDLVIVTSSWLEREVGPQARATAVIRNAGEFEFFRDPPEKVFRDDDGRRVIGYYGAIAEWFDLNLVRSVALAYPEHLVLLVGNDTAGAAAAFADLPNVRLTGEVPYAQLPYWLHGFDVCLLPFKVITLTLATNPVKIYEYLAAGKPVVAVDLPEMVQFDGLIEVARDPPAFIAAVKRVLDTKDQRPLAEARQGFAAGQTWAHRAKALDDALAAIQEPRVSVIVLTYNNLAFTESCLFSIEAYSDYSNLEVLVVDNASSDGSREWLQGWVMQDSSAGHQRKLILNEENLGFSGGNNVGLRAATGDVLVIVNNDTYVTPGWVRTLCAHISRDPELGLVGPVTNNIGNEAKLDIGYADMVEMIASAAEYTRAHPGQELPMRTAAFFCVAMSRRVYEQIGDMDENFGIGFFEDDDYCRRAEKLGLRIACAEDVFIHHHLSASFDKLGAGIKQELFVRNKAIYEAKWGAWEPHAYRAETSTNSPSK